VLNALAATAPANAATRKHAFRFPHGSPAKPAVQAAVAGAPGIPRWESQQHHQQHDAAVRPRNTCIQPSKTSSISSTAGAGGRESRRWWLQPTMVALGKVLLWHRGGGCAIKAVWVVGVGVVVVMYRRQAFSVRSSGARSSCQHKQPCVLAHNNGSTEASGRFDVWCCAGAGGCSGDRHMLCRSVKHVNSHTAHV